MRAADRTAAAAALVEAQSSRVPIAPLSETYADVTIEDAYEIQVINVNEQLGVGRLVRGHKVGLTARAMQEMLGVGEPDFGHLLDDMFASEGSEVPLDRFIQPRVEPEVAFVLAKPLVGPGVTVADVIRATAFVLPAIEIVDSRIADWKIALVDTVADNASSGAVVLGGSPRLLTDIDVRRLDVTVETDGEVRQSGRSSAVLGNPAVAVAWLANRLAAFGAELAEGEVIMPGACTRMIPIEPGQEVRVNFEALSDVTVHFQKAEGQRG